MESALPLIILLVLGVPLALAIWLIVRAVSARNRIDELARRVDDLQIQLIRLTTQKPPVVAPETKTTALTPVEPAMNVPVESVPFRPTPEIKVSLPPPVPPLRPLTPPKPALPKINWEQFMGVKGFAWLGGLALFLGVAFFIKYSFDNNLIPPQLRVAIGFLTGLGLLVGGVMMSRKNFPVLSQTLCATGVVILYAVTFTCRSIYHLDRKSVV